MKCCKIVFHKVSSDSAVLRPMGTLEALTDIHNDKNNELCPVFPRNSPICFCTKQQFSEDTALLPCVWWTQDSVGLDMSQAQSTVPLHFQSLGNAVSTPWLITKILLSIVPITVGFFSPLDFRAQRIIIPSFPICSVLKLDLMLKKNHNASTYKRDQ